MGQTLTHGVYLPDEGERNCYNGLAANWSILDGAVGTIAEHTTALAGKAPAVHTHTVSDITDFPAYGNAAGTICEGNDSRLSDARTPLSHTHTKSDVTDLLNSNFIPNANNSYDLGSSSYQWNNVYSKNYFYNGTAWGLDKGNTWTEANIFYKSIQIHGSRNAYIMPEFGASYSGLAFGTMEFKQSFKFGDWVDNNSTIGLNTSHAYVEIYAGLDNSDGVNKVRLIPVNTTVAELGTSTNQWKSLNGINPGALSLPDYSRSITIDTTNWYKNGNRTLYTPTVSGWLQITIPNDTDANNEKSNCIVILDSGTNPISGSSVGDSHDVRIYLLYPVIAGREYWIYLKSYSDTIITARLVQCQGNV